MPRRTLTSVANPRQWRGHVGLLATACLAEALIVAGSLQIRYWIAGSLGVLGVSLPMLLAVSSFPASGVITALAGAVTFVIANHTAAMPLTTLNESLVIVVWTLAVFAVAAVSDREHRYRDDLATRIMLAESEERRRISNDLHDDSVQVIVAALLLCDSGEHYRGRVLLRHALERLRTLSFQLRPPSLDRDGLGAALHDLCSDYRRRFADQGCQLTCNITITHRAAPMIEELAHRVTLEALQNAWKHAEATHVTVTATDTHRRITIRIHDNGKGFDPSRVTGAGWEHLGLAAKQERATWAGGTLTITSHIGDGSEITLTLPRQLTDDDDGIGRPRPRGARESRDRTARTATRRP